jgi:hypothetical protein
MFNQAGERPKSLSPQATTALKPAPAAAQPEPNTYPHRRLGTDGDRWIDAISPGFCKARAWGISVQGHSAGHLGAPQRAHYLQRRSLFGLP